MPTTTEALPSRVTEAIRAYVANRTKSQPISVASLTRATRYAVPGLVMTDNELSGKIARQLVDAGCDIDFDDNRRDPEIHITR